MIAVTADVAAQYALALLGVYWVVARVIDFCLYRANRRR